MLRSIQRMSRISYLTSRLAQSRYIPMIQKATYHSFPIRIPSLLQKSYLDSCWHCESLGTTATAQQGEKFVLVINSLFPTMVIDTLLKYESRSIGFGKNHHFRKSFIALHIWIWSSVGFHTYKSTQWESWVDMRLTSMPWLLMRHRIQWIKKTTRYTRKHDTD